MRRVFCLMLSALLAGCVATGQRDSGGNPISVDEKGQIEPWSSRFNAVLMMATGVPYQIEAMQRDNGIGWSEIIRGEGGAVLIEHMNESWFSDRTDQSMRSLEYFQTFLQARGVSGGTPVKIDDIGRKIVGWAVHRDGCLVTVFGKRLKGGTRYDNDRGQIDTVVQASICGVITAGPEEFARRLALASPADKASAEGRFRGTVAKQPERVDSWETSITWPGVISGKGDLTTDSNGSLTLRFQRNGSEEFCFGNYDRSGAQQRGGRWKMNCGGGEEASGTWNLGTAQGQWNAVGKDGQGRELKLTAEFVRRL